MSPTAGEVAQTPEPKSSSFASVFKSLTGSKSSKSPAAHSPASIPQQAASSTFRPSAVYGGPANYEQLFEQLKNGNPLVDRIAAARSLRRAVQDYPLNGVTSIFKQAKDLIDANNTKEARTVGFELLTACVQHDETEDPERRAYFLVLTAPANPEDFYLQLTSLVALAKNGKDLSGFHYDTLPLLTSWLRHTFKTTTVARRELARQNRLPRARPLLAEETNFSLLFAFIVDVIKFSFNVTNEETISDLIEVVLDICSHTTVSSDLKAGINVLDAIVTYGDIPSNKLGNCIKVLCSIHRFIRDIREDAWRTISNLCNSHHGLSVVRILLDMLRHPADADTPLKKFASDIRGALSVLQRLFDRDGQEGYPLVPFTLLMAALSEAVKVDNSHVRNEVMQLILSLFGEDDQEVKENVMEEDWATMFAIVSVCSQHVSETSDGRSIVGRPRVSSPLAKDEIDEHDRTTNLAQTLYQLIIRLEELLVMFSGGDFFQREDCIKFFVEVHPHLPESCAKLVIDHYVTYRYCHPSDLRWKDNCRTILAAFFADRSQPTRIRLQALKAATDVFDVIEMMDDHGNPEVVQIFVAGILEDVGDEKDIAILQEVVVFAVKVAETADVTLFKYVLDAICGCIASDRLQSPIGSPTTSRPSLLSTDGPVSASVQTPSNVVTKGLVLIFMRTMGISSLKATRVFDELLRIAKSHDCETDARISALKMLCRLRADWANRIFLTPFTESDGLAASLYRTPASLARKQAADEVASQQRSSRIEDFSTSRISRSTSGQGHPQARQPFRTTSGTTRIIQRNHQMWMSPDPEALPEPASGKSSMILSSVPFTTPTYSSDEEKHNTEKSDNELVHSNGIAQNGWDILSAKTALDISRFLEMATNLIEKGCDWEVYSYILVHLASQLTNQALFEAAIPQIKALRQVLCDQVKNNSFQEPPLSSGLRKVDVAICLYQILNMVMSYHRHFSKADQDEIVRTFLQGVGERTSKCCIHSLSICCHELPASMSKALVTILQKMSQIITQSHVAIHILEFLACLARLPNLYVNFREDEYRIVFAICFRYLQYVRDQQAKDVPNRFSVSTSRNSTISVESPRGSLPESPAESNFQPNTSDDLPQYVYALAYHVIIFWFLSLKLDDRAGQVGWIIKSLSSTDSNGKEKVDEQTQVTIDFMERVSFADVDESASDISFKKGLFGEVKKRRWVVGNSVFTVEQATRGDWAQITKRQPSGTSCFLIQERFIRPPAHQIQNLTDIVKDGRHQDENVKLPSHLMLTLIGSPPQADESNRPIPLPSDDVVERAMKSLDRNFTVDGHKVGVIYIGENQTKEVEILANIQGSSDYTKFLSGLGTLTKLKGATFNTQGLDRQMDSDGEHTFCWRDRVTEIVFHVTTQMPTNLDHDPQCINKKRHIGNDFVNIIFNNSGLPFKFDTFPSEFNYVNIVITPESRGTFVARRFRTKAHAESAFYRVQVMSKPGFPEISPAAETKIMSLNALPCFIRLLALNASVFSLVWANRAGGEHISSWRNRLREINRLKEKYGTKTIPHVSPPGTSGSTGINVRDSLNSLRRSSVANFLTNAAESGSQRSSVLSTAETEVGGVGGEESLIDTLDFSKWA